MNDKDKEIQNQDETDLDTRNDNVSPDVIHDIKSSEEDINELSLTQNKLNNFDFIDNNTSSSNNLTVKAGINKSFAFIITVVLLIVSILATYTLVSAKYKTELDNLKIQLSNTISASERLQHAYEKITEIDSIFNNNSVYELDPAFLEEWLINGYLAGTKDTYAYYYTADEMKQFFSDLNGESEGIGISVIHDVENSALEIINVFNASSGEKAGLLIGDRIITAGEDKKTIADLGYEGAVSALRGLAGTTAYFTVYRDGEYIDFEVERAEYTETSVTNWICETDDSVGIIRINSFNTATIEQFKSAVKSITDSKVEKLVLDVRYNPGGELNSVCEILDTLIPEGPIIRVSSGPEKDISILQTSDSNELNIPMAVLVNGSTASAGELFTAALQDYNKAIVVGTQTYGKGTMQSTTYLSDGSGLKLTTEYYYPPFSDNYDGVGITPDIIIEQEESLKNVNFYKISDKEDLQLQKAIELLNK